MKKVYNPQIHVNHIGVKLHAWFVAEPSPDNTQLILCKNYIKKKRKMVRRLSTLRYKAKSFGIPSNSIGSAVIHSIYYVL